MKEKTKKLILYIALCIFTVAILFMAVKLYENKVRNDLNTSYIDGTLTEIKYDEIATNLVENPNAVIYISNSSNEKCRNFEILFKKVIKQYNLENEIIYINIYNQNIVDPLYQNTPNIIFYKDKAVIDEIDASVLTTKNDIIKVLKERGIISD